MERTLKQQRRPREMLLPSGLAERLQASAQEASDKPQVNAAARRRRRPTATAAVEGHSLAWLAWGGAASLTIWMTDNPLYLLLLLLIATLVFLSCARKDDLVRSFRLFVAVGAFIFALQLVFSVVTAGELRGGTLLLDLPELRLPALLGGIVLGGPITAEQLAWGAVRGLRLWAVLLVLGAFNASVNHYRLLRRVPAFLFQGALVTTIALSLVPQTIMRLRSIREAQQLRGHRFRGLRDALPLLAPLVAGGLERSLTLAEAMESRGYGRFAAANGEPRGAGLLAGRLLAGGAALLLVLGTFGVCYSGALRPAGALLLILGGLLLVVEIRRLSRAVVRSRYLRERWRSADRLVVLASLAAPALLLLLGSAGAALDYVLFPRIQPPQFSLAVAAALLLLAAPALLLAAAGSTSKAGLHK